MWECSWNAVQITSNSKSCGRLLFFWEPLAPTKFTNVSSFLIKVQEHKNQNCYQKLRAKDQSQGLPVEEQVFGLSNVKHHWWKLIVILML